MTNVKINEFNAVCKKSEPILLIVMHIFLRLKLSLLITVNKLT